jgi:hypothetical protein
MVQKVKNASLQGKRKVLQRNSKNKTSPGGKIRDAGNGNFPNRSKEFKNRVKFHPLSKDQSAAIIRRSMNF